MATEKKYKGMTAYEVGKTQGHSKRKVDSMIASAKAFGAKHKALKERTGIKGLSMKEARRNDNAFRKGKPMPSEK